MPLKGSWLLQNSKNEGKTEKNSEDNEKPKKALYTIQTNCRCLVYLVNQANEANDLITVKI